MKANAKKIWAISAIIFIIFLIPLLLFLKPLTAGTKVLLFLSEEFPQIPIKPLHLLTNQPKHEQIKFADGIVADLYLPNSLTAKPALIIAMGVRTNEKDKPILLGFADTLARLGYVVMWPRLEALDREEIKFESPQTFIASFQYLEERPEVDKNRISFVGFSVGSSLAMVAAESPSINDQVRSLIFFGGYYNIIDYLTSLGISSMVVDGQKVPWIPHEGALNHAKGILEKEGVDQGQFISGNLKDDDIKKLLIYSPDQNLASYKAPIFILHEKGDTYVPYAESVKLKQALEAMPAGRQGKVPIVYHQANLFEHVQPKKGFSPQVLGEFAGLFGFLHKVFLYL